MLGKIFGKGKGGPEEEQGLPAAVQQAMSAPETVKVYSMPDVQTTRSMLFKFEGDQGLDLSQPGQQIVVIVPGGSKMNLQDVWLGHRNKPEVAGLPSGYLKHNYNGAYTEVEVFDANSNTWRKWLDPKGHDPVKYAEPRETVEYEKLGDYFGMLGEVRPVAFRLISRGKGDPNKSRVTEHSLEVVSYPEMHDGMEILEQNYSPGNGFVDFKQAGGPNRLPRYGGGKSHHKKGPQQNTGGEGGYPGAIALRGKTGYETWSGGLSESAKSGNEFLDEEGRLWLKLPKGRKLKSLEVSAGAKWWNQAHLDPILGVNGGRKISAYIVDTQGNKKDHFMRSLNVGPQGVLMGGPTSDDYVSEEGDWILIEGERAPSYLMGWRLMLEKAEGVVDDEIASVQQTTGTMVDISETPNLKLESTGESPGGTQGAKWYLDKNSGDRFLVKDYAKAGPKAADRCATEYIANQIYTAMGIPCQESYLLNGKFVAREIKGITGFSYGMGSPTNFFNHSDVKDGFLVDAWLANWDVFGLDYDNVFKTPDNRMVRLDSGGSLFFRAMGEHRPSFANAEVNEIDIMRNPHQAKQAGAVYQNLVSNSDIQQQAQKLVSVMTDGNIQAIVNASGISNAEEIIQILIKRRDWIANKYLSAAPVATVGASSTTPPWQKVAAPPLENKFADLPLNGPKKKAPTKTPPPASVSAESAPTSKLKLVSTGKTIGKYGMEHRDDGPEQTGHYLVKEYGGDVDRCATEYIANRFYQLMDIKALDARMIDGKFASKMKPGLKRYNGPSNEAKNFFNNPDVLDGFVVDAWLANWNVFGANFECMRAKGNERIRTENQGSLFYRYTGGKKAEFAQANVQEVATMRKPNTGAGQIYGSLVNDAMIENQTEKLRDVMTDKVIREVVESSGISNAEEIIGILIQRRDWLIEQYT